MVDVQSNPNPTKPHAIVVAYPLQGHLIPAVHFSIKLASKGFTITFVNVEAIHHQISSAASGHRDDLFGRRDDLFGQARQSGLDIRYTTVGDGFPLEFDRALHLDLLLESHLHRVPAIVDELVGDIVRTSEPPPTCLIADTFSAWLPAVAQKYNLVSVSFWTEPALVLTLYYHLELLRFNGHFDCKDTRKDIIDYVPGVRSIKPTDLMSYLQDTDTSTLLHQIIYKAFEGIKRADFIVCNTVEELEHETISALNQKQPTFAVGPLFPLGFTESCVPTSFWAESDCSQWLNARPAGSVLYISFGSLAHVNQDLIGEIAHGLWLSQMSFIWVLRRDIVSSTESYSLPVGFEEGIKDRGLIVPWCCQIEVLSHPSIGGFLTHCGWNSILESIRCGVPLLCLPVFTDQITNRKLVVDDWRVGVNLCDRKSVDRKEVTEKIDLLMGGTLGKELRNEMKRLKGAVENALAGDGSLEKNLSRFISCLNVKIGEKQVRASI